MKKIGYISLLAMLLTLCGQGIVYGQQRPVITQYMFNQLVFNPAYAGLEGQFSATLLYRDQWLNFEGAPTTTMFSLHTGIKGKKIGLGAMITEDEIGVHNDIGMYFSYSYSISMPIGKLSMGLQAGFNNLVSDYNKLDLRAPTDPIFVTGINAFRPNFGTGVYFWNKRTRLGLSVPYLINNQLTNVEDALSKAKEARNYYFYAAHIIPVNKDVKVQPSMMIRAQEGQPLGIDLNTNVILKDIVSLGMMYRSGDAISALFEFKIVENLHFGYAYDITATDISAYSKGTHEIMLNYRFKVLGLHEGIECATYF